MHCFYSDHLLMPLPEGHRFPLPKYAGLHQRLAEMGLPNVRLCAAPPATPQQLRLVHTADYVRRVMDGELTAKETRRIGFPWSQEMVQRTLASIGGSIAACRSALAGGGLAANLAGGTHHAYPDHGEGYCVFNDVAVALRVMQREQCIRRGLVIDLDVHQGNGSAVIFANDPSVYTFSIHGQKNFPYDKELSDLDVALPDAANDDAYLAALDAHLPLALAQAQADFAIYIAGADPYQEDKLGRMALTKDGLLERDRRVFSALKAAGTPCAVVMGGGYARDVQDVVDIHARTIALAANMAA